MSLLPNLAERAAHTDLDSAEPTRFTLPEDESRLQALLERGDVVFVHDTVEEQLGDLLESRAPRTRLDEAARKQRVLEHLDGRPLAHHGHWMFFPWSKRLVHVLPVDEHRELRTNRNCYKITPEEQRRLAQGRIGVIGLSVGNMAAVTLALEGIGTTFRVADFDHLSLSNLNRLRGGVHELGVNKTVIAAREMLEIDPYLDITRFPDGLSDDNLDAFLLEGGKLDVVVEECDDLYLKVRVRERCRELGIPVVMDTSDRGLFDIERFDLEPERPLLHGLVGDTTAEELRGLSTKQKVPFVLDILEADAMSLRMTASLPEIDQSIRTWPQLASGVALGGAITADAVRRMLLGQLQSSGRFYVDVEAAIADGAGRHPHPGPAVPPPSPVPESLSPAALPATPTPAQVEEVDETVLRWLLAHAVLAPSAHNAQPWRFRLAHRTLECRHDPSHDMPTLDFEHRATWLSFGAILENLSLAAGHIGLSMDASAFPDATDPELVHRVVFTPSEPRPDPLYDCVPLRVTNRRRPPRRPLEPIVLDALVEAARARGGDLHFATEPEALATLAELVGRCDRLSMMNPSIHREVMPGYRWSPHEVEHHRDGLDVDAMELHPWERAGTKLLSSWERVDFLRSVGGGSGLEELGEEWVDSAAAVGLLTVPGQGPDDYLRAGAAMQRMWLEATAQQLALHPITGLPFLLARVEQGGGAGLSPEEIQAFAALRAPFRAVFPVPTGHGEAFLFRVARADPPTTRSLRRPLDAFVVR